MAPSSGKYIFILINIIDFPKITITYDGDTNVVREKSADLPFLFSLPEV